MIKYLEKEEDFNGYIAPIGGGKDSCVSLEILKNEENNSILPIIIISSVAVVVVIGLIFFTKEK